MLTFDEMKKEMLKRPRDFAYWGELDLSVWGFAGFSTTRDADLITESNHAYVLQELRKVSGKSVQIMQCSHWACGWVDHILVRTTAKKTMQRLYELYEQSEDYAVLDDEDFSRREYEQAAEAYDAWARWDVSKLCEAHEVTMLLDADGDFDPTPEQEEKLRAIVTDTILEHGSDNSYDDMDLLDSIQAEFTPPPAAEVGV